MYLANYRNGEIYLRRDTQMDDFLKNGASIYYEDDQTGERTLVATPEDGFLVERPVFPVVESSHS